MQRDLDLIEPPALVERFLADPPEGFDAMLIGGVLPAFVTPFDLLTTLDPAVLRRIERLPLRWLRRMLTPRTCFAGTTVTEYAPLPRHVEPAALVRMFVESSRDHPFAIVKDLAEDATLIGAAAAAYAQKVARACADAGFLLVEGQALAYVRIDFASEDELLARMSRARRRNIRRKLRSRDDLTIEQLSAGDARFDDDAFVAELYALYRNVYDQSEVHFDLLTAAFFRGLFRDAATNGILILYRAAGMLIGWNFCVVSSGMLIDKYVGFRYPEARERDLYAVSWFHNLELARSSGLTHFVAGWTDAEVKRQLGAQFTFTRHAVRPRNRLLRALLAPLAPLFESDRRWHEAHADRR